MESYKNMSMTKLVQEYEKLKDVCESLEFEIKTSKEYRDKCDRWIKISKNEIESRKEKAKEDIEDVKQNHKGMFGFTVTKDGKDKIDDIKKRLDIALGDIEDDINILNENLKNEQKKIADREEKIKNAKAEIEKIREQAYQFKEVQEVTKTEIAEKTEELNKPFEKVDNTFNEIVSNPFDNIQKKNKGYNNFFSVQAIENKQNELFKEDNFTSSYNNKTDDEKDKLKNEMVNSAIRIYEVGDKFKDDDVLNKEENEMLDKINDILGIKAKLEEIEKNKQEITDKQTKIENIKKEKQEKVDKINELENEFAVAKITEQEKNKQIQDLNNEIQAKETDRKKNNTEIKDLIERNKILRGEIEDIKKDANDNIKTAIEDELKNSQMQPKLDISKLYAIERKNLEDQFHEMRYRRYNDFQSLEIKEKKLQDNQKTNIYTKDIKDNIYTNGKEAIKYIMCENQDKIDALVKEIRNQENSDIELGIKKILIRAPRIEGEPLIRSIKLKYNELEGTDIKYLLEQYILNYSRLENKQDITKVKDNYERTIQRLKDEIQKSSQVKNQPNKNGPNKNQPNQGSKVQTQQQTPTQPSQGNYTQQQTQNGISYGSTAGNPKLNPLINLPQKPKQGLIRRFWNGIKTYFKSTDQNQPDQGRQTRPDSSQNPNQIQTQGQNQSQTQNQNTTQQKDQKDQDQELKEMKPGEMSPEMRDQIIEIFAEQIKEEVNKNQEKAEKEKDNNDEIER